MPPKHRVICARRLQLLFAVGDGLRGGGLRPKRRASLNPLDNISFKPGNPAVTQLEGLREISDLHQSTQVLARIEDTEVFELMKREQFGSHDLHP